MNKVDAIHTLCEVLTSTEEPNYTESQVEFSSEAELARKMKHYVAARVAHWFGREHSNRTDPNFDYAAWAREVLDYLQRGVLQGARQPESYSSPLHNMRQRYYLAAQAEFVLNSFGAGDVAEAVHSLLASE